MEHDGTDDMTGTQPMETATGAVQLSEVLDAALRDGYPAEFRLADDPAADDQLYCPVCAQTAAAEEFQRSWSHRLEGASDPDELAIVSGLRCPSCGATGTFVSAFGPAASQREAAVLLALPQPDDDAPPVTE